jgi:AcrR family transcriptional regulator
MIMTNLGYASACLNTSKVRKPQKRGIKSAQRILDSAAVLFVEHGFESTSVDEIVDHAESSKGTFYHHYQSKMALLSALRQRVIEQHQDDVLADYSLSANEPLDIRLECWISASIESYISIGELHEVVFKNFPESRWTVSDMEFMNQLLKLLKDGHEKKVWCAPNPSLIANFIYRGIVGVIDDLIITQAPLTDLKRNVINITNSLLELEKGHV